MDMETGPKCEHRHCWSDWLYGFLDHGWGGTQNSWGAGLSMAAQHPDLLVRLDAALEPGPKPIMDGPPANIHDSIDRALTETMRHQEPGNCHGTGGNLEAWRG